eukprot:8992802-Karenia_brevis.AAC.1
MSPQQHPPLLMMMKPDGAPHLHLHGRSHRCYYAVPKHLPNEAFWGQGHQEGHLLHDALDLSTH